MLFINDLRLVVEVLSWVTIVSQFYSSSSSSSSTEPPTPPPSSTSLLPQIHRFSSFALCICALQILHSSQCTKVIQQMRCSNFSPQFCYLNKQTILFLLLPIATFPLTPPPPSSPTLCLLRSGESCESTKIRYKMILRRLTAQMYFTTHPIPPLFTLHQDGVVL